MSHSASHHATLTVPIIGVHHSPLATKFGAPRQPNLVPVDSIITLYPPYDTPAAFSGIEDFSHLWIVWQFHQNRAQDNFRPQVRPPRLGGNAKMGVFATRSMYRPSALGLSVVQLVRVEIQDNRVVLHIRGADMVDGTPIIDIKPYLSYVDSVTEAVSGIMDTPQMKPVMLSDTAKQMADKLMQMGRLTAHDISQICALIAQDPRPAYRQAEIGSEFKMQYQQVDVLFSMDDNGVLVVGDLLELAP